MKRRAVERIRGQELSTGNPAGIFWCPRAHVDERKIGLRLPITAHGRTQTLAEWAKETGLHRVTLRQRVEQARREDKDGEWIVRPRPSSWVARGSKIPGLDDDELRQELTGYHGEFYLKKVEVEMERRGLGGTSPPGGGQ